MKKLLLISYLIAVSGLAFAQEQNASTSPTTIHITAANKGQTVIASSAQIASLQGVPASGTGPVKDTLTPAESINNASDMSKTASNNATSGGALDRNVSKPGDDLEKAPAPSSKKQASKSEPKAKKPTATHPKVKKPNPKKPTVTHRKVKKPNPKKPPVPKESAKHSSTAGVHHASQKHPKHVASSIHGAHSKAKVKSTVKHNSTHEKNTTEQNNSNEG